MKQQWEIESEGELNEVLAEVFMALLETRDGRDGPMVLALHGDLGAGKTTAVQHLAEMLGYTDTVNSPTFVIMKSYPIEKPHVEELVHIDAYRIEDVSEMETLGLPELLVENTKRLICIEWAERIQALLPKQTLHLSIQIEGEKRVIMIHNDHKTNATKENYS